LFLRLLVRNSILLTAILCCLSPVFASESPSHTSSATKKHHASRPTAAKSTHGKRHHTRKSAKARGQQKIDPHRARDIQEALIRNHYLSGQPTGTWDANSQKAMEKFQANNGWQTKEIPDSRALIKLGLGPDQQHLLNPESAMTTPEKMRPAAQAKAQATPSTTPASTVAPAASDTSTQN